MDGEVQKIGKQTQSARASIAVADEAREISRLVRRSASRWPVLH
jgi:hypothetical protein